MPALIETARENGVAAPPPQLAAYCYKSGAAWTGNAKGRPLGAKSKTLFLKAETRITKEFLKRSVEEDRRFSNPLLAQAMDKILPDASVGDSSAGLVPIFVIVGPRSDAADGTTAALSDAGTKVSARETPRVLDAEPSAGTEHG